MLSKFIDPYLILRVDKNKGISWSTLSVNLFVVHVTTRLSYRQISNIGRTIVGNKIVDHSDVVGASPVGAAQTKSSFSLQWFGQRQLQDETKNI